jgi:hypothetical protein
LLAGFFRYALNIYLFFNPQTRYLQAQQRQKEAKTTRDNLQEELNQDLPLSIQTMQETLAVREVLFRQVLALMCWFTGYRRAEGVRHGSVQRAR